MSDPHEAIVRAFARHELTFDSIGRARGQHEIQQMYEIGGPK
jgi:hypothetical protein